MLYYFIVILKCMVITQSCIIIIIFITSTNIKQLILYNIVGKIKQYNNLLIRK